MCFGKGLQSGSPKKNHKGDHIGFQTIIGENFLVSLKQHMLNTTGSPPKKIPKSKICMIKTHDVKQCLIALTGKGNCLQFGSCCVAITFRREKVHVYMESCKK